MRNIVIRLLILFLPVIFNPIIVNAQEVQFPAYSGFKIEKNYPVYTPDDLWDYINGAAESYISLGFTNLYIAEYTSGKKINVKAEVYCHLNPVLAFGIYSMERSPSYNFINMGVQGYSEEGLVHFTKGKYYVKVISYSKSKKALASVMDIAVIIEQSLEGTSTMPGILDLFPAKGRLPNEEVFISESVIGHGFLRNAFRASYLSGEKDFKIYIFVPGTEQANREMLDTYLGKQGLEAADSADGKFFFKDGYNGEIFLAWESDVTVLITGLAEEDASLANEYINQIIR
ncbi:MAG: hypothetical protein E4G95_03590 [Bacteroidia bacterium]|nr:MAG: hypothetical protein E4G95_03590 [Bacteroidia bacterium]